MPDPYDVLTIAAVVDELSEVVGSGRIQRIGLIDGRSVGAEIYAGGRRHYLLMSADDRQPRLHLVPEMPSLDPSLRTPFGLLLRKYLRGSLILDIDQPPLERIARLSIVKRIDRSNHQVVASSKSDGEEIDADDLDESTDNDDESATLVRNFTLYVELMGRHSNLILVDGENRIVESAKRVTPAMSRVRSILPRLPYLPPPPPDRLDPRTLTAADVEQFLVDTSSNAPLARALVSNVRGLSPQMANEIVFRSTGLASARVSDLGPDGPTLLVRNTLTLLEPLQSTQWSPRLYRQRTEGDAGPVATCSPIPMAHLAALYDEIPLESISLALTAMESSDDVPEESRHVQRRQRLIDAVVSSREKAERRLAALGKELERATESDQLRLAGEMIYAYLWQIAPGQSELSVDGMTIGLDPDLTAQENAQDYFERYRKAQNASAHLPELETETRAEIAYLAQLATLIAQAPGFTELEALAAEWNEQANPAAAGNRPKRKSTPRRPAALFDAQGNSVYVGHSGPQNELITFEIGAPDDLWLHARGVPGSHVIVHWQGSPDEDSDTVSAAASLAAWYSSARRSGSVEVDVAPRRHVRKLKRGKPGMVTYRNERTLRVQPRSETELRDMLRQR